VTLGDDEPFKGSFWEDEFEDLFSEFHRLVKVMMRLH
jgi:hypothetical protein